MLLMPVLAFVACEKENGSGVNEPEEERPVEKMDSICGFFLMNEGNMGTNKCTIDYYDYSTGKYTNNIFSIVNKNMALDLGDSGNDMSIYGDKLYTVVNGSNIVEVMDANTARHITQIPVANCRNIAFDGGYAYVSSYAGASMSDSVSRVGYVARIDTLTLQVTDSCMVGYQPEEMAVHDGKLYVANSGGYCYPDYDNRVSVIDLNTFKLVRNIEVEVNLHRMAIDVRRGVVYVSSRGDYYTIPSAIYAIDAKADTVLYQIPDLNCADIEIAGDSLYVYSTEFDYNTYQTIVAFSIYDIAQQKVVSRNFITDGTEGDIVYPYGMSVNPENGDIYITDAKDFVTPGMVYCYDRLGNRKWAAMTGDIPGHFAYARHPLNLPE